MSKPIKRLKGRDVRRRGREWPDGATHAVRCDNPNEEAWLAHSIRVSQAVDFSAVSPEEIAFLVVSSIRGLCPPGDPE